MTQVPDIVFGMMQFLKSDTDTEAFVNGRIFGGRLPEHENKSMPRPCIVVRPAGNPGYGASESWLELAGTRFDIWAYGATPSNAYDNFRCLYGALRQMTRNTQGRTVIHWAKISQGPVDGIEQDTAWPYTVSTWQVMWSEREVNV